MAHFERIRDVISEPFSVELIRRRTTSGWQMVSIEWRREVPESEAPAEGTFSEDIPYGLRISDDCRRLEVDPIENRILMLMMELLVQDFPYSSVVSDLNEKGFRMRDGPALEPGSRLQHDATAHRGRAAPVLDGGVGESATRVFLAKRAEGVLRGTCFVG